MRRLFFETLAEIGEKNPRIVLLTADLGYLALESFAERCPQQFFNVGVSEQNMIGLATGLAESGFFPFVYSITPFVVLRPYEFIRNGPVAHRLPVRIVSVGAGLEYGTNGISHYGLEDVGVLRTQPGLHLITPADKLQARAALQMVWNLPGPLYFRLSKDDQTVIPGLEDRFAPGRTQTLREGDDLLLIALGTAASDALCAAEHLHARGISVHVELVDNLNGSALETLAVQLARFPLAVTVEAHYVNGGLGSLVCEMAAEGNIRCRVVRCGVAAVPDGITGSQSYLHQRYGISGTAVAERVIAELGTGRPRFRGVAPP
ncbi:MAG: transketolase family protein [Bryobacteraceae bacterium]